MSFAGDDHKIKIGNKIYLTWLRCEMNEDQQKLFYSFKIWFTSNIRKDETEAFICWRVLNQNCTVLDWTASSCCNISSSLLNINIILYHITDGYSNGPAMTDEQRRGGCSEGNPLIQSGRFFVQQNNQRPREFQSVCVSAADTEKSQDQRS